ncbi:MAG: endopeptidase La [Chloroflexi bacterium]|nr:endopeptidase La [Chloroflexota bacterium]
MSEDVTNPQPETSADLPRSAEGDAGDAAPQELPILPSRDTVLFPHLVVPLTIGRPSSVKLIDEVASARRPFALVAQRDPAQEEISAENMHSVGTAAMVTRLLRQPDGTLQVLVQGIGRVRVLAIPQTAPYLAGRVEFLEEHVERTTEVEALQRNLANLFQRIVELSPNLPDELAVAARNVVEPGRLADFVAAALTLRLEERQQVLEATDVDARLRLVTGLANRELEVLEIGSKIQGQIREQMDKTQREYYLREQLKAIQRELGEVTPEQAEAAGLRQKIEAAGMPEEARKEAERELERLQAIPPASPEHGMIRTYLDWMTSLPWATSTVDVLDVAEARRILDEDHYDLDRVKDRILEYLAVRKLRATMRGPILCFVGPPGVGKTSLGQSIARAMGRKFIRMSLGGIRDEAEIRGHRRTYIGALPGRIVQGIRRAGSHNPVFMLDEVDKLTVGFQGDPAAALLEVLDPAQNATFVDNYLGVAFDLSRVLFIATGNVLDTIPPPLLDRMEIIQIPGYVESEKLAIARRYLVHKQLNEHGLAPEQLDITDPGLRAVIQGYTREAGVRNLDRTIAMLCRKVARKIAEGTSDRETITPENLAEYLGPRRYKAEAIEQADEIGVATGLAVTAVGGEVLFVEVSLVPGKGNLILTGQLGEVMRESAQAALTYNRSRAERLGAPRDFPQNYDVHIHVPAGAVPKDGPSAGITMATALASALSNRPVHKEVAMTGEVTLRGKVLPIGGVKEKVLAAHRAGVIKVLLPAENERDVEDVPADIREAIQLVFVEHMDQVLEHALHPARLLGAVPALTAAGEPHHFPTPGAQELPRTAGEAATE